MYDTKYDTKQKISIHAPAKGATGINEINGILEGISIHAPAKGATVISLPSDPGYYISIHAPAKGATDKSNAAALRWLHFNPRSREGSDIT